MAVGYDNSTQSHASGSYSVSATSFSWSHTVFGTPKGVLVFVYGAVNSSDDATSVTYGGTTVPAVSGGRAVDSAGEPGSCKAFFLGSGIPTGTQTVVVNRNNTTTRMCADCITVTALTDTAVHTAGIVLQQGDQGASEASVTDGSPGTNSMRFGGGYTGAATPVPAGTNSTQIKSNDLGNYGCSTVRETLGGQGSRSVGFYTLTIDDWAAVLLAVKEYTATTALKDMIGCGIIPFAR